MSWSNYMIAITTNTQEEPKEQKAQNNKMCQTSLLSQLVELNKVQ